jgi:catechol 2,3-dioxygenase-like lactoylglutathione lyase family enzyme
MKIPGVQNVTAICDDPQANVDFYSSIWGIRLAPMSGISRHGFSDG